MNWNNVKITIFKEIRGIIRDKKSFEKLLIYPLLIPFIIMLFGFLFDVINETTYTVGINYNLTAEEKIILKEFDTLKTKHYVRNIRDIRNENHHSRRQQPDSAQCHGRHPAHLSQWRKDLVPPDYRSKRHHTHGGRHCSKHLTCRKEPRRI